MEPRAVLETAPSGYKPGSDPVNRGELMAGVGPATSCLPGRRSILTNSISDELGADDRARTGTYDFTRIACCHSHSIGTNKKTGLTRIELATSRATTERYNL